MVTSVSRKLISAAVALFALLVASTAFAPADEPRAR